jgi:hypothetical protein
VDRAALDHAGRHGLAYEGWVPAGGWAEDEPTPPGVLARYPRLRETATADPAERTRLNVRDSDATLLLTRAGARSPGSHLAIDEARRLGRPALVVDLDASDAVPAVVAFLARLPVGSRLHVAGPRESEWRGIGERAAALLAAVAVATRPS